MIDSTHPAYRPAYRETILAHARPLDHPPAEPTPTVAESWALTRAMHACAFWSRRPGCCTGANCALRRGAVVSHTACFDCLKRYG